MDNSCEPALTWRDYQDSLSLHPVLRHSLIAFVENGYHATSVRDLAKRLGQTVPAIYYHYENKQALLVALLTESIDDLLWRCRNAQEGLDDDPAGRIAALVECIALFTSHRRMLAFLDAEIRSLEPENRRQYVAKRDLVESMMVDAINDGVARGVFAVREPRLAARAVIAMCRGIASWYRPGGTMSTEDLARQYVEFAFDLVQNDGGSGA